MRFEHIREDIEDLLRWMAEIESERDDLDYDNQLLRERIHELEDKIAKLEEENDELSGELYLLQGEDRYDNDKDYI